MLLTENLSSISPMIYIVQGKRQSLKQKVNVNINAYSEYEDLVPSEMLLSLMWITSMSNSPCPAPESYLETNDWQSAIQVGTKASIKYRPDHTIEIQIQYFVTRPQIPVSDFQIDHFAGSIVVATSYLKKGKTNCFQMLWTHRFILKISYILVSLTGINIPTTFVLSFPVDLRSVFNLSYLTYDHWSGTL